MLEQNQDMVQQQAEQLLILQAVAEKAAIEVTKDDIMTVGLSLIHISRGF